MSSSAKSVIRQAASLIICRPISPTSPEFKVLLLKRNDRGSYAGLTVFPGGAQDPSDADPDWLCQIPKQDWRPDTKHEWQYTITAIRETFEECGLLLFSPESRQLPSVQELSTIHDGRRKVWREKIHNDSSQFLGLARKMLAYPSVQKLIFWSRWITPKTNPSRFDTRFYLTVLNPFLLNESNPASVQTSSTLKESQNADVDELKESQNADVDEIISADESETVSLCWMTPKEALAAANAKRITFLPPQYITLLELSTLSIQDLSSRIQDPSRFPQRSQVPILPEPIPEKDADGNPILVLPGDYMHSLSRSSDVSKLRRVVMIREGKRIISIKPIGLLPQFLSKTSINPKPHL